MSPRKSSVKNAALQDEGFSGQTMDMRSVPGSRLALEVAKLLVLLFMMVLLCFVTFRCIRPFPAVYVFIVVYVKHFDLPRKVHAESLIPLFPYSCVEIHQGKMKTVKKLHPPTLIEENSGIYARTAHSTEYAHAQ